MTDKIEISKFRFNLFMKRLKRQINQSKKESMKKNEESYYRGLAKGHYKAYNDVYEDIKKLIR